MRQFLFQLLTGLIVAVAALFIVLITVLHLVLSAPFQLVYYLMDVPSPLGPLLYSDPDDAALD